METFFNAEYIIRLFLALALGFSLGLERELTNKYAGLRTHILVCLGACIFTLLSIYAFPTFATGDNVDIAQATGIRDTFKGCSPDCYRDWFYWCRYGVDGTGLWFLGLLLLATLWIAASIGMACGAGMYDVAIIATVLSVAVLTLIRILERQLLPSSGKQVRRCKIVIYLNGNDVEKIYNFLNSYVDNMTDFSSKKLLENPEKSKVSSIFDLNNKRMMKEIYGKLRNIAELDSITLQELND